VSASGLGAHRHADAYLPRGACSHIGREEAAREEVEGYHREEDYAELKQAYGPRLGLTPPLCLMRHMIPYHVL